MPVQPELIAAPFLQDPSSWLAHFEEMPNTVFFDSGLGDDKTARYHIITAAPQQWLSLQGNTLTYRDNGGARQQTVHSAADVWALLTDMSNVAVDSQLPFCGGIAGLLGYEFGRLHQLGAPSRSDLDFPDLAVGYYPWALVQDMSSRTSTLCILPDCPPATRAKVQRICAHAGNINQPKELYINKLENNIDVSSYQGAFDKIQHYILDGDCYQINLTQRFSARQTQSSNIARYRTLRQLQPGPMAGFFCIDHERALLSLSPERLVRTHQSRVLAQPIKGTTRRGANQDEDRELALALQNSTKDKAENLMIVDLLRNDLGKVCAIGSVAVPELFALQSFKNVHHLVSSIRGQLAPDKTPLDLLAACFPGGSVTGAPKHRAMEIIDEVESHSRSGYCGSLFYLSSNGNLDANITIRSLIASPDGLTCWGGGAITAGSVAEDEYQESVTKVENLLGGSPLSST